MLTTILASIGIGFAHLIIGAYVGKWGLKVWNKREENWQSFLLFPITTCSKQVGCESGITIPITEFKTEEGYIKTMAFVWSIKLIYHLVLIPLIGVIYAAAESGSFIAGTALKLINFTEQPVALLKSWSAKRYTKRLEKAKQLKLSAIDPMLDGYTRSDIEIQMEEQRRIIEAGTKKIETSKTEYERLKKIHEATWPRLTG